MTLPYSCVIQVFIAVAWQHEVRRCDANSDSFTARIGSALLSTAWRKHRFVYYSVIAGAYFDVTILTCRKYATIYFRSLLRYSRSRDSSVDIATGFWLDSPGSIPGSARFFSSPQRPEWNWGSPILLSNGYQGIKWQGHEAAHSPPFSAEVKKGGAIPPPACVFIA
jgi:hypothetical protein